MTRTKVSVNERNNHGFDFSMSRLIADESLVQAGDPVITELKAYRALEDDASQRNPAARYRTLTSSGSEIELVLDGSPGTSRRIPWSE